MAKKSALAAAIENAIDALTKLAEVAGDLSAAGSADVEQYDRDEIEGLPIKELRELAASLELDEQKVKSKILDEMEAKGLFTDGESSEDDDEEEEFEDEEETDEDDEDGDEDEDDEEEDDEDEDEEDEDDEEAGYDREELEGMSLVELKKLAKQEGHNASVYRKMDQDALIDLLAGDEGDEDEEEEEEEIDEDTLRSYDLPQLKKVAAELQLKVPATVAKNKNKLVNFILESAGEEDDE